MLLTGTLLQPPGSRAGGGHSSVPVPRDKEFLLWALGVVLTMHLFNWFGIVYFDQYYAVFFMQLAALSTFSHQFIQARRKNRHARASGMTLANDAR